MKAKNILLGLLFIIGLTSINAQKQDNDHSNHKPFDITEFQDQQEAFFKKELNLTDAEAKNFLPLVNEFMAKKFEISKVTRAQSSVLRKKENKTEANYQKAIDALIDSKIKEAALQKEYYKKFGAVLSADKVYKYYRAEVKFMRQALEKHKQESRQNQNSKKK